MKCITQFRLSLILAPLAFALASCAGADGASEGVDSAAEPTDLLALSADPAALPSDPEALPEALVSRWIDGLGGMDAYWALKSARYTLTTEIYDTESGRLRRTRPRYVTLARTTQGELSRIERWEGNDFIEQAWDGQAQWATLNSESLSEGDKDYDQVPYVSGDVQYWISLPYKLRDDGVNLHYRGRDEAGRHIVGVSFGEGVGLHDEDAWQYWFEEDRVWPVQLAYMEVGDADWSRLRFEDIQTVDGYTFVGRRVHFNAEGQLTKVLATSAFALNPTVDEAVFTQR
jgi:hypothetical protein